MTWPIIFLLVVLKIPIVYLCAVIWWAVKAEPRHEAPAALVTAGGPVPEGPAWRRASRERSRPPRGPARKPAGPRTTVRAYARR